jgi:carbon monoxide dehydrogenase subunit G
LITVLSYSLLLSSTAHTGQAETATNTPLRSHQQTLQASQAQRAKTGGPTLDAEARTVMQRAAEDLAVGEQAPDFSLPSAFGEPMRLADALGARTAEVLMLQISESDQQYRIRASFLVDAPLAVVHALLTDYEQLPRLSPSILESEVVDAPTPTQARVRTRIRACVLIYCQTLRRVEEVRASPRRLVAVIIPEQSDFAAGRTEWLLTPQEDSVRVDYRAQLEPGFQLFPLLGPALMKAGLERELRTFLGQLQARAASM